MNANLRASEPESEPLHANAATPARKQPEAVENMVLSEGTPVHSIHMPLCPDSYLPYIHITSSPQPD